MDHGFQFTKALDDEFRKIGTASYPVVFQAEDGRVFIPTGEFSTDLASEENGGRGTTFVKVREY